MSGFSEKIGEESTLYRLLRASNLYFNFSSGGMIEKRKTRLFDVTDFDPLVTAFELTQMLGPSLDAAR